MYTISFEAWQSWLFIFITVASSIVIGYVICRDTYHKTFIDAYKRAKGHAVVNVQPYDITVLNEAILQNDVILIMGSNEADRQASIDYIISLLGDKKTYNLFANIDFDKFGSYAYDYIKACGLVTIMTTAETDWDKVVRTVSKAHFLAADDFMLSRSVAFLFNTVVRLKQDNDGVSLIVNKYISEEDKFADAYSYCIEKGSSILEKAFDIYSAENYSKILELNRERIRLKSILLNKDLDIDLANEERFYNTFYNYINHKVMSKVEFERVEIELLGFNEELKHMIGGENQ